MTNTQPGWHPQPDGQERYWNGQEWTDQYRPAQPPTTPPMTAGATPISHKDAKKLARSTRPWWKKKRFVIPIVFLLLAIIWPKGGGDSSTSTAPTPAATSATQAAAPAAPAPAPAATQATSAAPAMAGIGQTVKEGDIEFTVKSWKCGARSVGPEVLQQKAQGKFCIADVTFKNVGNEPKTFDAGTALTARQGEQQFKPDSIASATANENDQTFLQQVNPGNVAAGKVVFDVPKTAKIERINVVDGFTGEGTPIKVG